MNYRLIYRQVFNIWKQLKESGARKFWPEIRAHAITLTKLQEHIQGDEDKVPRCWECGDSHSPLIFPDGDWLLMQCVKCAGETAP